MTLKLTDGMMHATSTSLPASWFAHDPDRVVLCVSSGELQSADIKLREWIRQIEVTMATLGIERLSD